MKNIKSRLKRAIKALLTSDEDYESNLRALKIASILLDQHGNKRSFENRSSIDGVDNPLPWFTYPAIEYLNQIDLSNFSVLEWGCGNSSRYFSKRCNYVDSIESNREWYEKINNTLDTNCTLHLKEIKDDYVNYPKTLNKKFDIVVIDGVHRDECIRVSGSLHSGLGFIIFDNSDRNPELCKLLRDENYLEIDFHGFGPINAYTWTTSLFFTKEALRSLNPILNQPAIPVGGGF